MARRAPGDPIVIDAGERGWLPPPDLPDSWIFRGHATFIAGVIRQVAPDCRILSVQVVGNDGTVQGADSLRALNWLAAEAESGDPDRFVDVVCVAYGYTPLTRLAMRTRPVTGRNCAPRLNGWCRPAF